MNRTLHHTGIALLTIPMLLVAGFCSFEIYSLSKTRASIKTDYSAVNNISYGLLSVDAWKNHLLNIVAHRIDDFSFTPQQEKLIKYQLEQVLHAVINKADTLIHQKQKTFKNKLKKLIVNTLVNEKKIHEQVPLFSQTILNEIKKEENRAKLKSLVLEKIQQYGAITYDSVNDVARMKIILKKYEVEDIVSFNAACEKELQKLSQRMYVFTAVEVAIIILFLLAWWMYRKQHFLHNQLFTASVVLALTVLIAGLTAPMIEIDARIKDMSFLLMGEHISFHDQVIFFQSKSIVDVVHVLIDTGKWDSMMVGVLILVFSILFPVAKLLSSKLYMLDRPSLRSNKVIRFFALKSGKWSMADVYVVAVFMAYIGFKGILDNQLNQLNFKTNSLASISTNETTLQPGFLLFICYVLFGLILASILETTRKKSLSDKIPQNEIENKMSLAIT